MLTALPLMAAIIVAPCFGGSGFLGFLARLGVWTAANLVLPIGPGADFLFC